MDWTVCFPSRHAQVRVPVLWQCGSHHDQPSRGGEEGHGGLPAPVLLRLRLRCPAPSAPGHLPQVNTAVLMCSFAEVPEETQMFDNNDDVRRNAVVSDMMCVMMMMMMMLRHDDDDAH